MNEQEFREAIKREYGCDPIPQIFQEKINEAFNQIREMPMPEKPRITRKERLNHFQKCIGIIVVLVGIGVVSFFLWWMYQKSR